MHEYPRFFFSTLRCTFAQFHKVGINIIAPSMFQIRNEMLFSDYNKTAYQHKMSIKDSKKIIKAFQSALVAAILLILIPTIYGVHPKFGDASVKVEWSDPDKTGEEEPSEVKWIELAQEWSTCCLEEREPVDLQKILPSIQEPTLGIILPPPEDC